MNVKFISFNCPESTIEAKWLNVGEQISLKFSGKPPKEGSFSEDYNGIFKVVDTKICPLSATLERIAGVFDLRKTYFVARMIES